MSQIFIDEVRAIVLNNFSDEKFGVPELASQLGLSSSQTLRKVKKATGKSVNQYIRELRLEKAAELLKKTDFTIAEISYQVGFGSPSYFNTTFSNYYSISPGEYKTKSISLSELTAKKIENKRRKVSLKMKIFYPVIIAFIFVIGYLLINSSTSKNTSFDKSIAVLPFKDLSPEDSQWFSDGVSDNILHSLAQMKDLSVISFTSSSSYRNTDKQIPEIAKELGVSYILEGSVTIFENRIKIIAQLIDANDKHVWSKEYNESFENVIAIQNNVAQKVLKQLEITLSPPEEKTLKKYPTENMEAYSLFLKGRLVNDSRNLEDLEKNLELNKQAIALDSTFAEAYAEVANSYYQLARYGGIEHVESIDRSKYYFDKALEINPNTVRALDVKGMYYSFKDWDKANKAFKKAITINPSDALSHNHYAQYYFYLPEKNLKRSLEEVEIAQQLNPFSNIVGNTYMYALINSEEFEIAETYLTNMGFLISRTYSSSMEESRIMHESRLIAHKNKDWRQVIPFLKTNIEKEPNNTTLYIHLGNAYNEILKDKITALTYIKKAYDIDSTKSSILKQYVIILLESEKYNKAKKIMQSKNYKLVLSKHSQLEMLWHYYYLQNNKEKTKELATDSLLTKQYFVQVLTYAQLGDRKKVDSIHKKYVWGGGIERKWRAERATVQAVLKNRDSMYYFLERAKLENFIRWANSRKEFDPYRNEERFKAVLRENYIPVSGE